VTRVFQVCRRFKKLWFVVGFAEDFEQIFGTILLIRPFQQHRYHTDLGVIYHRGAWDGAMCVATHEYELDAIAMEPWMSIELSDLRKASKLCRKSFRPLPPFGFNRLSPLGD
jgi:hypothetical protein